MFLFSIGMPLGIIGLLSSKRNGYMWMTFGMLCRMLGFLQGEIVTVPRRIKSLCVVECLENGEIIPLKLFIRNLDGY